MLCKFPLLGLSHPLQSGSPHFSFSLTLIKDFLGENAEAETIPPSERGGNIAITHCPMQISQILFLTLVAFGAKFRHVEGTNPQHSNAYM